MIKPQFEPDELVQQKLVQLYSSNIVQRLNAYLPTVQGRRADFVGSTVGDVEFGMLVEDMRASKPTPLIYCFFLLLPTRRSQLAPAHTRDTRLTRLRKLQ